MKYGLIYDDNDKELHFCINVFPVYRADFPAGSDRLVYDLLNLVYVPSKDKFDFNHSITLPKRLAERYVNREASKEKKDELESLGYVNYWNIRSSIVEYNERSDLIVYKKYYKKINNINDTSIDVLVKENQNLKELIFNAYKLTGTVIDIKDVNKDNDDLNKIKEIDNKTYKFKK